MDPTTINETDSENTQETTMLHITVVSRKQPGFMPSHNPKKVATDRHDSSHNSKRVMPNKRNHPDVNDKLRIGKVDKTALEEFKNMLMSEFHKYNVLDDHAFNAFFNDGGFDMIPRNTRIEIALTIVQFATTNTYWKLANQANKNLMLLMEEHHIHSINDQLRSIFKQGNSNSRYFNELSIWYYVAKWAELK